MLFGESAKREKGNAEGSFCILWVVLCFLTVKVCLSHLTESNCAVIWHLVVSSLSCRDDGELSKADRGCFWSELGQNPVKSRQIGENMTNLIDRFPKRTEAKSNAQAKKVRHLGQIRPIHTFELISFMPENI